MIFESMELNGLVKEENIRATDHSSEIKHKTTCAAERQFPCSSESSMSVMSTSSITLSKNSADYLSYDSSQNYNPAISSFIDNYKIYNDFHYFNNNVVENDMEDSYSSKMLIRGTSSLYKNVENKFNYQNNEYLPYYNMTDSFSNQRIVSLQDVPDSSSLHLSSNFVWFFPLANTDNICFKNPVSHAVDTGVSSELLDLSKNNAHNVYEDSFIPKEEASYSNAASAAYADYQLTKHISAKQYCKSKLYMLRVIFPIWAAHADSYRWHWRKIMGCKDSMLASYIVILSQVSANHFQNFYSFYFTPENSEKRIEVIQVLQDLDELRVMEDVNFISLSSYPLLNVNMNEVSIPTNGIMALTAKANMPQWNVNVDDYHISMNTGCENELRGGKNASFLEHNKGFQKDSVVCYEQPFICNYDMSNSLQQKPEQCREDLEIERKMHFDNKISADLHENELSLLLSLKNRSVSVSSVGSLDDPTRPTGNKCESQNIKVNRNQLAEKSEEFDLEKHAVDKIKQQQNMQQNYSSVNDFKEKFFLPPTQVMDTLSNKSIFSSSQNLSAHTSVLTSKNKLSTRGKRSPYYHSSSSLSDDNQATTRRIKPGIIYTSKVAGVSWRSTPVPLWRCRWRDPTTGRDLSKCFSIKKYGFEHAKRMAEEWVMRIREDILLLVNRKESNGKCSKIFKDVKLQKKKHNNIFSNEISSQGKCDNAELRNILRGVRYHNRSRAWIGLYKVGDTIKEKYFFVSKYGYNQAMKAANRFSLQNLCSKKDIAALNECEMNKSTTGGCSTTINEAENKENFQNFKLDCFKVSDENYSEDGITTNYQERNKKCDEMEAFATRTTKDALSFDLDMLNSLSLDMEDVSDSNGRPISCGFTNSASMDGDLLINSERYVSDVQGVIFDHGCNSWRAYWTDPDTGKQLARRFSVRKYGINKSRIMAEFVRKAVERVGGRLPNFKIKNESNFFDNHGENQQFNNGDDYTATLGYAKTVEQENSSSGTTLLTQTNMTKVGNNSINLSDNFLLNSRLNESSVDHIVSTCSETTASLNCMEENVVKQEDKERSNHENWLNHQHIHGVKISECENGSISTASNSEESEMNMIKKPSKTQFGYGKEHKVEENAVKKVKTRVNNYVDFADYREKHNELYAGQILHLQRIKKDGKLFVAEVIFVGPRRVRVRWIEGCTDASLVGAEQHINLCDFWQRYQRVKVSRLV